ncbi:MAG: ferrochelatase [Betaproteobacteria bacterium]|jgi:ferrochelatase|nr:ferrochelatase [Pseudomonadota bacterium]NBO02829.1 ferrochelatase [Betaproteobacteria bacterium]HAB47058.1 ferrochelatase [Lautropia sp.]NBO94919.1 ferrochelatase [Betaproteobacteria bacterium]NBP34081.1 ferrochelatase [Betaproteobacteria bacterium]
MSEASPSSRYSASASFRHNQTPINAVLLVQLGTPEAAEPAAVRRYLAQFLADPRVVEIPRLLWMMILHGIILRFRPAASAKKYASIWTAQGSPLALHTVAQADALAQRMKATYPGLSVRYAMRYGEPSIVRVMRELREAGMQRLLVLPLYPQYAASTTATVWDEVFTELKRWRNMPELRMVRSFHRDQAYIESLAARIREHWAVKGRGEKLVFSFHGVPKRSLMLGDPYHCECHVTARLLAQALGLSADAYQVTFQSRFGRAEWLQPYTEPSLIDLAGQGIKRVDVFCPGFVSDCLETLEEIAQEARHAFLEAGGEHFEYISCVNNRADFIEALAGRIHRSTSDWQTPEAIEPSSTQAAEERLKRARALGADR